MFAAAPQSVLGPGGGSPEAGGGERGFGAALGMCDRGRPGTARVPLSPGSQPGGGASGGFPLPPPLFQRDDLWIKMKRSKAQSHVCGREIEKAILKFMQQCKGRSITKAILKKKVGRLYTTRYQNL